MTLKIIQELNGFRALVADDNMDSCVSVEKMLRTIGLRPEWTTSGKEAVFRAKYATEQNDPFHVYIIDWLMPDMNGVEVVRRIRSEIGDEVPIIILTAYDWSDIEDEAREAGVTAFCAKPLFLSELYDVLTKEIEFQSLEIELCEKRIKEYTATEKAKNEEIAQSNEALEERKKDLDAKKAELEEIVSETKQEEEKLREKAKVLETTIEPRLLHAFKRIRKNSRNGRWNGNFFPFACF